MDPFIGQIILFSGNFAPRSWALCEGQLLSISQHTALFSLLGTTYGGDGRTTFALPDLRGRVAISHGTGPGLTPRRLGSRGGSEENTLMTFNLPQHNHKVNMQISSDVGEETSGVLGASPIYAEESNSTYQGVTASEVGANVPVANMAPVLTLNYIIALEGVFPSRS